MQEHQGGSILIDFRATHAKLAASDLLFSFLRLWPFICSVFPSSSKPEAFRSVPRANGKPPRTRRRERCCCWSTIAESTNISKA